MGQGGLGIYLHRHHHHCLVQYSSYSQSQIDAEKTPFLCDRLKIRTIPTVIMVKDSITRGYIVGFTDLGNTDEFSTEMLAWRLGHAEVINYKGDLNTPPDQAERKKKTNFVGKKMRMGKGKGGGDESSDENDW